MNLDLAKWIPWLPALGAVLCGLCCLKRSLRRWAAAICIVTIASGFIISFAVQSQVKAGDQHDLAFANWIHIGTFNVGFSYLVDSLTIVMLLVVTGIGTLVAIYAAGYMAGDRGYARFFAAVCLFIFTMTTLVMADNLVLLYLGWEGVGLCSYLLIGFHFHRPAAVAAAKKAFIVNRIGDLGFAVGIFLVFDRYGTVSLAAVVEQARSALHAGTASDLADQWIPFLLMLGAFGKSAQFPLHVWLPDAMEGPTPVSALIHAATMVTAGVYLVARLLPVFEASTYALPTVAAIGSLTALFAATIAMCQYDIKRVFAYSTISQLGYMFLGVGALSTAGGIFHLFTHAFFKALLFLTAGSVMHALAGQLDLRKMSGLKTKMPITATLMLIGCFALAGLPPFAGFFSKDKILAEVLDKGINDHDPLYIVLAIAGLLTALLTAFYTFRLWFRVFLGPAAYQMGQEHLGRDNHGEPNHDAPGNDVQVEQVRDAHEVSWLMNGPLVILAVGSLAAGFLGQSWIERMVAGSTAHPLAYGAAQGVDAHEIHSHGVMVWVSSAIAVFGILAAAYFHWIRRERADAIARKFPGIVRCLANKYYVDELYDAVVVRPLHLIGELCYAIDRLIISGLVQLAGFLPRLAGLSLRPSQAGSLQGYGLGMAVGVALILVLALALRG